MSGSIPAMVVPILANPDKLYAMLRSMDVQPDRLIVIDNGGVVHPVTLQQAAHNMTVTLLTPGANLGVAGSWNLGIKCAPFAPWWLIVNFDIVWPMGAMARMATAARRDALVLSAAAPPWACFALGDQVVSKVGLFDEGIHPAYFEDDDYTRRCAYHRIPVVQTGIFVDHDNSSTIRVPEYQAANGRTFPANHAYYTRKVASGDMSPGEWSLDTRRANSWD